MKTCTVEGCETYVYSRGYCSMHYQRINRTGTTDAWVRPATVPAERFWVKVEKTEGCWNWTGASTAGTYGTFWDGERDVKAHRFSWILTNGPVPDGMHLDHTCYNTLCVNPRHMRPVTQKQNNENRSGASSRSKSGVRGVYWDKSAEKWAAQVSHLYKKHYVGLFTDLQEAEAAVIAKRNELFTHNDADRRAS